MNAQRMEQTPPPLQLNFLIVNLPQQRAALTDVTLRRIPLQSLPVSTLPFR